MTTLERLGATRRAWLAGTVVRGVLLAAATGLLLLALVAVADLLVAVPFDVRSALRGGALLAALTAGAMALHPLRSGTSTARVALWVEERVPPLRYALVTLAEQPSTPHRAALEDRAAETGWDRAARRAIARALVVPAAAAAAAALLLVALPDATLARVAAPRRGDAVTRPAIAGAPRSAIATVSAVVTPPAYTGERRRIIEEPALVTAIVGSRLQLRGRGDASRVGAIVNGSTRRPVASGDMWTVTLAVPSTPLAIVLRDSVAGTQRIVAVEPRADGAPRVTLERPARDSVLRAAAGRIPLRAQVLDDFGIASLHFEWIVSAGEGENFAFRSGAAAFAGNGAKARSADATLSLDSLELAPGSMVHVRAVARDQNTVSGPGEGVSETRVLRIARPGEYDSIAVEAAAPAEADKSALSQRMLIMQAEALEKRRPRLSRQVLVREASVIARDQAKLRKRVGELVFQRLEGEDSGEHSHDDLSPEEMMAHAAAESGTGAAPGHGDESPVVAINQPLLEAYNAMWEAQTSLAIAELRQALPAMYRALAAIQRARAAERLYLRGRPNAVVIDLAKVRLAGPRPAGAGARTARPAPAAQIALERRFERVLDLAGRDPAAAADSLTLLRLSVVGDADDGRPALAAALADAAARLRGTDSRAGERALRTARRALLGEPRRMQGLPQWGAGW